MRANSKVLGLGKILDAAGIATFLGMALCMLVFILYVLIAKEDKNISSAEALYTIFLLLFMYLFACTVAWLGVMFIGIPLHYLLSYLKLNKSYWYVTAALMAVIGLEYLMGKPPFGVNDWFVFKLPAATIAFLLWYFLYHQKESA